MSGSHVASSPMCRRVEAQATRYVTNSQLHVFLRGEKRHSSRITFHPSLHLSPTSGHQGWQRERWYGHETIGGGLKHLFDSYFQGLLLRKVSRIFISPFEGMLDHERGQEQTGGRSMPTLLTWVQPSKGNVSQCLTKIVRSSLERDRLHGLEDNLRS